jgi:hypothetical protein
MSDNIDSPFGSYPFRYEAVEVGDTVFFLGMDEEQEENLFPVVVLAKVDSYEFSKPNPTRKKEDCAIFYYIEGCPYPLQFGVDLFHIF